jgi:protein-S-isoprenylcysteine O-methyltransferase Ste14
MFPHDSIRSLVATLLLAIYLPVALYMTWIHALDRLWKKIGSVSYLIHWTLYVGMVVAIIRFHSVWRWRAWPWPVWMSFAGLFPIALGAWLAYRTYATIDPHTLLTFRQIHPDEHRRLIRDGVLGTIRHPRYVMYVLLALGNVIVTGYPIVVASLAVSAGLFAVVIHLEERELREHFGEEFEEYRREVPAFLPRIRRPGRGTG